MEIEKCLMMSDNVQLSLMKTIVFMSFKVKL